MSTGSRIALAPVALLALSGSPAARDAAIGFTVNLSGTNRNLPYVAFKNTSTTALIKDAKITIGGDNALYNFDNALFEGFGSAVSGLPTPWTTAPSGSFTQFGPDNDGAGGLRA